MSKNPELIVMTGEMAGKRFTVPETGLRLGRSSSNDVSIPDEELSRNHCLFERNGEGGISVIDLASANGTFINGEQLGASAVPLAVGDVIEVGASRLCVVGEGEPAPAAKTVAPNQTVAGAVDLGLGSSKAASVGEASVAAGVPVDPSVMRKRKIVNLICAAAATVLVVAIVMLLTNDRMTRRLFAKKPVEEKAEAPAPSVLSLTYERVEATAERIARYAAVVEGTSIDLLYEVRSLDPEEEKKVAKKGTLSKSTEDRLVALFGGPRWGEVRSASGGTAESMNELRSWSLTLARDGEVKTVLIENTLPTGVFREFCEAFETGINNDLQVSVSMRTAKECKRSSRAHEDEGDDLIAHAEVLPGNLWNGLSSLKMARHDLEGVSGCYDDLSRLQRKIDAAEGALTERYDELNGRADQLLNLGRWRDALEVYRAIVALIPDGGDGRNLKAEEQIQKCDAKLSEINQNGGRK